jgi:glycosyltransferase involved in cell wall biosynthesis
VQCALGQRVTDHHVVVVSDGCRLPRLPADPRLSVVTLRRRYGSPALARNVGIRASRSDHVAFLDDDNTWTPDHLASLLPALAAGADLAYGAVRWVDADDRPLGTLAIAFDRKRLRDENFVDTNATVVTRSSRSRFRVVPRRRGDATFEDWELAWRLSRHGRVVHVPVATANVRVHAGSQFSLPRPDQARATPLTEVPG